MGRLGALLASFAVLLIAVFAVVITSLIPRGDTVTNAAFGTIWFALGGLALLSAAVLVARMKFRARRASRVAAFPAVTTEQPLVAAAA